MQFLTVVVLSLAVAGGYSELFNEVQSIGRMKDLVDAALAYAQGEAKEDPVALPNQLGPRLRIENATLTGTSKVVVDRKAIDEKSMRATLRATIPKVSLEFDYSLNDTIFGRPISGDGHFKLIAFNMTYDIHNIELYESHYSGFEVSVLDGDYYVDDLTVQMGDLKINGETASDVGKLIETLFHFFYHLERKDASKSMCSETRHQLNSLLYGRTIEEATQWLKNHTK